MSELFEVVTEADDVLLCRYLGEGLIAGSTMRMVLAKMAEAMHQNPHAICINDFGQHSGISAEAVKLVSETEVTWTFPQLVFFNGTLGMRAVAWMVMHAMLLIGRHAGEVLGFEDERSMREWLAKIRPQRTA